LAKNKWFATIASDLNRMKQFTLSTNGKFARANLSLAVAVAITGFSASGADVNTNTNLAAWITRPLALADCLDLALQQNGRLLKARSDLEAAYGVVVQTRAVAIPKIQATGSYTDMDPGAVDRFPSLPAGFAINQPHESWNAGVQLIQSIYEGGRVTSALRSAKLTKEQALLQYQTTIADTLLAVRVAYYDVLLAAQQITVQEASVNLLTNELQDQQRRFDAGTVPRFNVLRAEVEVANARPRLISARNANRIARNNLVNLLGCNMPRDVSEDIPLQLTGTLEAEPYQIELPAAITQALEKRTELAALRKAEQLRREGVASAQGGYKPSVQVFAGYGWRNSQFTEDIDRGLGGWNAGAQMSWNIFDGRLTKGKVQEAEALYEKSRTDVDDTGRQVELEVRTAYSNFIEAREVLESQKKVQEEAEEALRLARARSDAGTGTQLDVLDAQTSLTEARTTQVQALHDYAVARAHLERAIGQDVIQPAAK
jgi:TolC family type I secretion outer membrane protein